MRGSHDGFKFHIAVSSLHLTAAPGIGFMSHQHVLFLFSLKAPPLQKVPQLLES